MIGRANMEREVLVLATGGTIAMRGARAVPAAGPSELLEAVGVRGVRKVDSAGSSAFGSPGGGPLGRVVEGRFALRVRPLRLEHALAPERLDFRMPIVVTTLSDDLALLDAPADDAVVAALSGSH